MRDRRALLTWSEPAAHLTHRPLRAHAARVFELYLRTFAGQPRPKLPAVSPSASVVHPAF